MDKIKNIRYKKRSVNTFKNTFFDLTNSFNYEGWFLKENIDDIEYE
jgi:hypothetical protein